MEKKELRIGNLVSCDDNGHLFYIKTIDELGCFVFNRIESTWIEYDKLSGVLLTKELFLKFGFEKKESSVYLHKGDFKIDILKNHSVRFKAESDYIEEKIIVNFPIPIKHIHQLQNLYFALTNQELTDRE